MRNFSSKSLQRAAGILVALIWFVAVIGLFAWMAHTHTNFKHVPRILHGFIRSKGAWGPVIIILLYVLRSYVFAPSTVLIVIAGSLYGPIWGTVLNLVGENVSAMICFASSRLLGRKIVEQHETSWMKKYDDILTRDGFVTVLIMRLFFFPFDIVSFGAGMTGITFRQYALATFLGLLPACVTLTVLGDSFSHPEAMIWFIGMLVVILALAFILVRQPRVKRLLGIQIEQPHE